MQVLPDSENMTIHQIALGKISSLDLSGTFREKKKKNHWNKLFLSQK